MFCLAGLAREVLRSQPSDIYAFGAAYFDNLLRAKSGKIQYWNIIYYDITISAFAERTFFFSNKNDFWEDGTIHRNVLCHKCCIKQNVQEMKNWIENMVNLLLNVVNSLKVNSSNQIRDSMFCKTMLEFVVDDKSLQMSPCISFSIEILWFNVTILLQLLYFWRALNVTFERRKNLFVCLRIFFNLA